MPDAALGKFVCELKGPRVQRSKGSKDDVEVAPDSLVLSYIEQEAMVSIVLMER